MGIRRACLHCIFGLDGHSEAVIALRQTSLHLSVVVASSDFGFLVVGQSRIGCWFPGGRTFTRIGCWFLGGRTLTRIECWFLGGRTLSRIE